MRNIKDVESRMEDLRENQISEDSELAWIVVSIMIAVGLAITAWNY